MDRCDHIWPAVREKPVWWLELWWAEDWWCSPWVIGNQSHLFCISKKVTWRRGVERCDAKSFWAGIAVGIGWPGEKWSCQPWQLSHWILPTSPKIETHNLFTCIRFWAKFVSRILFYQESKLMIHSDCRLCCSRRLIWCDPEQIKNTTHIVDTLYCVFV